LPAWELLYVPEELQNSPEHSLIRYCRLMPPGITAGVLWMIVAASEEELIALCRTHFFKIRNF
jgi:hypothetical protein